MSADLERDLRALADDLVWPATPDLATRFAMAAAEAAAPPAKRRPRRRLVALAAGVALLVPAGAAFGGDVLEWLGLRSVEVRREDRLPPGARRPSLDALGPRVTLAGAASRAGFRPVVPERLGAPDEVRERGGVITLVYDGGDGRLLLAEVRGALERGLVEKTVGPGGRVRPLPGGAVFLSGADHAYAYVAPDGSLRDARPSLAGNTLLVERGDLLLRLEGRGLTAARALALLGR